MTTAAGVIPDVGDWHGRSRLHPYFVCDVFTSRPLQGNQLGVFVDGRPFSADEMQRVASSRLPVEVHRHGPQHVYVALEGDEGVAALEPDLGALTSLNVAANCFAGSGRSWKTRMFYPAAGVPEDAATGSAAGSLAVHLARHGEIAFGDEIEIRQGEEIRRPSVLYATATGAGERIDSVEVGGRAVIVA